MVEKVRVGLFDDHPFFIEGLVSFLKTHSDTISVCFTADSHEKLETLLKEERPDVLILDVVAPNIKGLDLFTTLLKAWPDLKIIAYTSLQSTILIEKLLRVGVKGYVNKNQPSEDLLIAIKEVYYDLMYVPDDYIHLLQQFNRSEQKLIKNVITDRELDIVRLIAQGNTSTQMAAELGISLRTIENMKQQILEKLDVKNGPELVLAATRLGYVL